MNDDISETVYFLQKVKEDPNSFCCQFLASIYTYLIVYQTKRQNDQSIFECIQYGAEMCMIGYKAPRLEGMK